MLHLYLLPSQVKLLSLFFLSEGTHVSPVVVSPHPPQTLFFFQQHVAINFYLPVDSSGSLVFQLFSLSFYLCGIPRYCAKGGRW